MVRRPGRLGRSLMVSLILLGVGVAQEPKPVRKSDPAATVPKRKAASKLIDINSASKQELMKLPGITGAYADAILAGRPYNSKFNLLTRAILPKDVFATVRKRIEDR